MTIARMASQRTYRIVVDGELGGWLAHYVGDATIQAAQGTTTIVGIVSEPSEFTSLTMALFDLGLEIERATLL